MPGKVGYAVFAAMFAHAALPKVMVMMDEKALGSVSTSEIETMAVRKLSAKGVETVDQSMVQANLERIQKALDSVIPAMLAKWEGVRSLSPHGSQQKRAQIWYNMRRTTEGARQCPQ